MDFMNRGNRPPVQQNTQPAEHGFGAPAGPERKSRRFKSLKGSKWGKWLYVLFVAAVVVLIIAVLASIVFAKDNSQKEFGKVDNTKYQAVFLNGGQVYFGKITDLNAKYLSMNNIYYLRVNQQVQPNQQQTATTPTSDDDISLVKLGCELHGPQDSMVINQEQIIFWENLKDDGQVAKAVAEYAKANPNGQNCSQQNSSTTPTSNGQ